MNRLRRGLTAFLAVAGFWGLALGGLSVQDGKQSPFGRRKPAPTNKAKRRKVEEYQKKLEQSAPESAADHLQLARWCRRKKLAEQAGNHYRKAIELDPNLTEAKEALGWRKIDGEWKSPREMERMKKARAAAKHAVGLEVRVAVAPDISRERLREMGELFAGYSGDMWFCTRGNFYFKSVTLTDQSKTGNVRVGTKYLDKKGTNRGGVTVGPGTPGGYMVVAGKCAVQVFIHEGGHLWLGLSDEYMNKPPGCPACVMVGAGGPGMGPGTWKICDSSDHTAKGPDCWTRIRKKFPKIRYPNPDWPMELPFDTMITVNNTGS